MKRILPAGGLLLALLLLPAPARAQSGGVKGRVVDEKGQGLPDVAILVDFEGATVRHQLKTDKNGWYLQIGLKVGLYKITASKEGYEPYRAEEHIGSGEPTVIADLVLKKAQPGSGGGELQASFSAATDLLKKGDLDGAEAGFTAIIAKKPGVPEAHYNLGLVYMRKKDWDKAAAEFQQAVDIKPEYTDAWINLAKSYQEAGDKEKALATLKEASSENSDDPAVQFNLGVFFLNAQQLDEAEDAFKKAQAKDPNNAEILYHMATITLNKGDTAGAVALLEKYLAASPKNAQNMATARQLVDALKKK